MMQKTLSLTLILLMLLSLFTPANASQTVGVTIDGTAVSFTQSSGSPFIDSNSRTLVPLRAVMEQYGCKVGWDQDTYTASVTLDDTTVLVPIGVNQITINEKAIQTDSLAQIKDGRTYLPIRAVLEAFGAEVGWDNGTRTVTVLHPGNAGLRVHFINVGQADCILVTEGLDAMLIDAGNNEDADTILAYLHAHGIRKLKYLVGTHPHEDHIGSMDSVIYALPAENILMPKVQTNTRTFEDVLDAALFHGLAVKAPQAGDTYTLGGAAITAVSNYSDEKDLNNSSIMLRLVYGETSFLFTGDGEEKAEQAALQTGLMLDSDVLKVGHHGSRTSSCADFLAAVTPTDAVISCGQGNDYGHPHAEVLDRLQTMGTNIYRTDTQGTVTASSDGTSIVWSKAAAVAFSGLKVPNESAQMPAVTYILNTNTMKFHYADCSSVAKITAENRQDSTKNREALLQEGFSPCGNCKP